MKVVLLFTVTLIIFFMILIPIMFPFGNNTKLSTDTVAAGYVFWYIMCFIFSLVWGHVVYKQGCWFFSNNR